MHQESLFFESFTDALADVARCLGGYKRTGAMLRPELPPDQAGRWLANALDTTRAEKLSPDQVAFLIQEGRRHGCHTAMVWLAREAGYSDPRPVEPEDEMAALQREYIEAAKAIKTIAERIERVQLRVAEGA